MPRNGSGTYNPPPAYNPVVSGTQIRSDWANTTLTDMAQALSDSISADGQKPMSGSLRLADGSSSAPSLTFNSETGTGFYRTSGLIGRTIAGAVVETITASTNTIYVDLVINGTKSIAVGGNVLRSVATVAAAGTTQGTATALTKDINAVTSASGSAYGVALPASKVGVDVIVWNNTGQAIYVYPPSGGYVDYRAVNTPITLSDKSRISFICYSSGNWISLNSTYA